MTDQPKRLRRAESFLGIHFDLHAGDDCKQMGKRVTPRMVEKIVEKVRPDYIQCDCKGHRGLCSYMTKVGHRAPGFVKDQLRVWRNVTAKHGVALYMHYSGVWDNEAIKRHPSWARIDENGKRDPKITSVFGPYVDKLLIPQLKELCDDYGVDGVWLDGECWATCQDYHKQVLARFRKETGIRTIPKKLGDKGFFEFTEFCREGFREYARHYTDALHAHNPDFQIASNWAFSSFMPEPVTIDIDYISGDYPMQDSVRAARLEGRCMAPQGKPWDLMAWAFCSRWGEPCRTTKTVPQLQQEAAIVLALGGGFQAYFKQKRDGSIYDWTMALMAETAQFCRARQAVCHKATAVPQIALLLSSAAFYRSNPRVFSPWEGLLKPISGMLCALLDGQNAVEVLNEHHLTGRLHEYPLVVIPEWDHITPSFKRELVSYVKAGGNVLCIGPKSAKLFQKELGVQLEGEATERARWLEHGGWLAGVKSLAQSVTLGKGVKGFGRSYAEDDTIGPWEPAASIARCGKGRIAGLYISPGEGYLARRTSVVRDFLNALVRELFPKPMVEVAGSHNVDVTVNRKDGRLCVNLVNTAGPHADENVYQFDDIPPAGPLDLTIRFGKKPKSVTRQPDGRKIRHDYAKGVIRLTVSRLAIHDVIVVE